MNQTPSRTRGMKPMLQRIRFRRFSAVQLLIALALLFTCAPFVEEIKGGDLIVSLLLSLVLLSGVFAVADRKYVLVIAVVLAIPAIAGRWINHFRPDLVPPAFSVLRASSVSVEVLRASISSSLWLGC